MNEYEMRHPSTLGEHVSRMERRFFIGRTPEKELFQAYLEPKLPPERILNVYGTGGIGKSFLLDEWARLAEERGVSFWQLDSKDFPHTPAGFCSHLASLLPAPAGEEPAHPVQACLQRLNLLAEQERIVIALDTYEEWGELDYWLRETFLSRASAGIVFVFSGRFPLQGGWIASPAWRRLIRPVPIAPFDLAACQAYAEPHGVRDDALLRQLYTFTQGHPLTLSLMMGLPLQQWMAEHGDVGQDDVLREVTYRWLREVPESSLGDLVEAAALVRSFHQELLETMLGRPIDGGAFTRLTRLSFVRPNQRGYHLHDLLRTTLSREIRLRTPKRYQQLWQRSLAAYHREIVTASAQADLTDTIADLLYGLGDSIIRSTFMEESPAVEYRYETVQESNLQQAKDYIERILRAGATYERSYYDPQTGQAHRMDITAEHDRIAFRHLEPDRLMTLGSDVMRMIVNTAGEPVGLVVFIPIHRDSLDYLLELPVARHYFLSLSAEELAEYRTPPEQPAGWYIYHLDVRQDDSLPARSTIMRLLLTLVLKLGVLLFSSPLSYHLEICKRMGFHEVPGAAHADFGPSLPAATYRLDLRGPNQRRYFDAMIQRAGMAPASAPALPPGLFGLTDKEREVAHLVLSARSIAEIAEQLVVTPVAVKKHLGRIYKKAEVPGKTQLLKKLMELTQPDRSQMYP